MIGRGRRGPVRGGIRGAQGIVALSAFVLALGLAFVLACGAGGGAPTPAPGTPPPVAAPPTGPATGPGGEPPAEPQAPPVLGHRVLQEYPHDPEAFTQGLFFHDGTLYESTGLRGASTLRRVALETGEVLQQRPLLPALFGEGAALADGQIVQLTWQAGLGFVYDLDSFRLLREFRYAGEGWGLTFDGERLIMSDGTDTLRFLDPDTFRESGRLRVRADGAPLDRLNELEWIEGEIWANLWTEDRIARIDPETGAVTAFVDLEGLLDPAARLPDSDVLNGIAWDDEGRRLFVTGKKWPTLFEIEIVEPAP